MDDKNTAAPVLSEADSAASPKPKKPAAQPPEFGGPEGPDPTRYGDWERGGRCVDF